MLDLLKLLFVAAKYSARCFTMSCADIGSRRLQYLILLLALSGTVVFVAGVIHIIRFKFDGSLWVWLLIAGGALWGVSGCIGVAMDERSRNRSDSNST